VRVRIATDSAYLNIKSMTLGMARDEFEYPIPLADAAHMLAQLCSGAVIEKYRHHVHFGGLLWEIDEFLGANAGLIVAEVELESESQEIFRPAWVGQEVTADRRYYNVSLVEHPYQNWPTS
ncbi:MAG: adenylate cyclase, partial [Halothiobacillus sp. 20-53-49]